MNLNEQQLARIDEQSFLITGGAGFIGSHITEWLLKMGAKKVRVIDNFANGSRQNVDIFERYANYEFWEGDIRNAEFCMAATEGINAVSHQAALGSVPRSINDPATTNEVNVTGFLNVLNACRKQNIQRFVFASSSSVYGSDANLPKKEKRVGNPLSPYAVTKVSNEHYARVFGSVYGMETIGLRYFNVFGPRQNPHVAYAAVVPLFVEGLIHGTPIYIHGNGDQTRDFTFVQNAAYANLLALTTNNSKAFNEVYNVAVGERYSILRLYKTVAQHLGSQQLPTFLPPRQGDIADSHADISKARRLLNYQPQVRFEEGVARTIAYFEEQQAAINQTESQAPSAYHQEK